jgi:hypothetical protein
MKIHINVAAAAALCAMVSMPMIVMAQVPIAPHPKKAAATAPLTNPAVAEFALRPSGVAPLPPKPPVVTAVAPWHPVQDSHRSIIFVGGKPQTGSDVELNPQPIPPGHSATVGPTRKLDYGAFNPQPIPPGHSLAVGPAQRSGYAALNPQPIPPGHGGPVDPQR